MYFVIICDTLIRHFVVAHDVAVVNVVRQCQLIDCCADFIIRILISKSW